MNLSPTTDRPQVRGTSCAIARRLALVALGSLVAAAAWGHTRITTDITWSEDVRAIVRQRCMPCHSPNGIAPSYADFTIYGTDSKPGARAWATAIEEEILTGRMPPWDADPRYGVFANARRLTAKERDTIVAWVRGGAPQGPRRNLPAPPEFAAGAWRLGAPGIVVEPPEPYTLAAGAARGEQRSLMPLDLAQDTWITGFEFLPEADEAIHRITAWIHDPKGALAESLELEVQIPYDPFREQPVPTRMRPMPSRSRFLGQWLPGDVPTLLPEAAGKRLRAGSSIELVIEYRRGAQKAAREIKDLTRLGLVLARTPDEVDLIAESTLVGALEGVSISQKERGKPVVVATTLEEDLRLVSLNPRLSDAVSGFEVIARYPDRRSRSLVLVPHYRPDWPASFVFSEPLDAPAGTRLELVASFGENATGHHDLSMIIDHTLDDHLVLPEVIAPRPAGATTSGGMLTNLLGTDDKGVAIPAPAAAAGDPTNPNASAHMDHTPLHGGQFFMAPNLYHHIEGALPRSGVFTLYVYDDFKRPVDPHNFAGRVVFERYDQASGDFDEEEYPLALVAGTDYLEATISPEMPAEFFASVWLGGEQQRFDFYFEELSNEPAPSARPALSAANTDHSHLRPPLVIPTDPAGLVAALGERLRQLEEKIAIGDWQKLYVPAFDGRDLAEALLDRLEQLAVRDRGLVRKAVSRVMQSAGELDRAGDLADPARARQAVTRFASGVRDISEAFGR